jgi:hypothetical protein
MRDENDVLETNAVHRLFVTEAAFDVHSKRFSRSLLPRP